MVFVILACFLLAITASAEKDKLLLVLFDGFRWDYVDSLKSDGGFKQVMNNGVRAHHMVPIYPSDSFPNYFAIAAGLYAESSGFVANFMYDPDNDVTFHSGKGKDSQRPSWFSKVEPIWTRALVNNISVASFEWPLAMVPIRGLSPEVGIDFDNNEVNFSPYDLEKHLFKCVDLFASGQIEFCQTYTAWPDIIAHIAGPDVLKNVLLPLSLDEIMKRFYNYLKEKNLEQKVNIIFLSDHGMTYTDPLSTKPVTIDDVISIEDIKFVICNMAHMGIYPESGKEEKVYNQLKNSKIEGLKIYKRNEIPDSYHLKNNNRVPPIYIEVLKGYFIYKLNDKKKQIGGSIVDIQDTASHGYNPIGVSDMWGTFIASGPAFKKGISVPAIENVDVYNLLCHLLGIKALPNNGTWDHVKDMLNL